MATIVTRAGKGSPLTHTEVDANFTNLNTDKIESGNTVASLTITSADINGGTVDNAAIGNSTPAAGTFTTLTGNSTSQFGRSSANYIQAVGAATTLSPELSVLGSDTNIPFTIESKGTGAVNLAGGSRGVNISNGGTVTAITRTAAGGSYTSFPSIAISAPTTAGGVQATATCSGLALVGTPTIAAGGTGYTVGDTLTLSGFTGTAPTVTVATVSGGVITSISIGTGGNFTAAPSTPASVTGGTGTGATVNFSAGVLSTFTITNAGSGYVEQPTVTFSGGGGSGAAAYATVGSGTTVKAIGNQLNFYAANTGIGLQVYDAGGGQGASGGYWRFAQNFSTGAQMVSTSTGGISSGGATNLSFFTNTLSQEQLRVAHTASAVNYVQVTGAATGASPIISSQGSDSNIDIQIRPKGTGVIALMGSDALSQIQVGTSASSGNTFLKVVRSNGFVDLQATSGVTNGDIQLTPKGTGTVVVNGPLTATGQTSLGGAAGSESLRVLSIASAAQRVIVRGQASAGSGAYLGASSTTDTDVALILGSQNAGAIRFSTARASDGTLGADQFRVSHTASAVNYVQVTGSATGGTPTISAQGSDSNIEMRIQPKGTGVIGLMGGDALTQLQVGTSASSGNTFLKVVRSNGFVDLQATSGVTDGDIQLTPKGAGYVKFGTHTATALTISGYIEIKDSAGNVRKLAVVT